MQPLPSVDWHIKVIPKVFYQASLEPGHAADASYRPVESNSPPEQKHKSIVLHVIIHNIAQSPSLLANIIASAR